MVSLIIQINKKSIWSMLFVVKTDRIIQITKNNLFKVLNTLNNLMFKDKEQ